MTTTLNVPGAALRIADVVVDTAGCHRIDHFAPYPGLFVGDGARRAYDANGWCCTVGDHEPFHIQNEDRP